ncbi:MAG: hypothetical protein CMB34_06855 [Euryarchaeota archaeon]|nr:hypothetical protein [Euryarchaeota archaeon]
MEEEEGGAKPPTSEDDDVLRERSFKRPKGLNLDSFMVASTNDEDETTEGSDTSQEDVSQPRIDPAVGEVRELFQLNPLPTEVSDSGPPTSSGEQTIGRGLAVAMVVVWTAIGALVGTVLPPVLGGLGLVLMAVVGLYLGERWIQLESMHLLGITWVIISMKLLYGLALDAWRWGWLDGLGWPESQVLGALMLALVGMNVGLAFRHDEDAIAAQSALVLFAIGSSAGAVYGETGIAVFIVMAMALMHGLALVRSSGNLASLGISMSYLWVGVHALSNDWNILSLTLLPIENDLTLFLLLSVVTAANASMAAAFVHHENWLSQAVKAVGLGKPGLWAVSVSLGMVGALMAIAAHRSETGYALAQLMLLTLAFTSSYLVVRGVSWTRLMPFVLAPMPFLIAGLALLNADLVSVKFPFDLNEYSVFAVATTLLCIGVLLNHQARVSDHVLWMGALVIVLLLTLLIPADDGGQNARLLLGSQGVVWLGLGYVAVRRSSPSMAGVAVLAPYGWLLVFATNVEQRLVNADLVPIVLSEVDLGAWMLVLVVQQISVNHRLGEANLNLAGGFAGLSEMSSRVRDSDLLNLWNLGFMFACLSFVAVARPEGLTAAGVVGGMAALLLAHAVMTWLGLHRGRPHTLVLVWSVAALVLAWRFGMESAWGVTLTFGSALLIVGATRRALQAREENDHDASHQALPGRLLTLHLGMMTALFIVMALGPQRSSVLTGQETLIGSGMNTNILTAMGVGSLVLYMQRLRHVDALLPPTTAAIGLLIGMALAGQSVDAGGVQTTALAMFVFVGAYLAFQGDVRSGLRALAAKEERQAEFAAKRERVQSLTSTISTDGSTSVSLKQLDAQLLTLSERQKKRSKRTETSGEDDLLVGDIHYRPVVLLLFLVVAFVGSMWFAYSTPRALLALAFSAGFSVILVGLTRLRADGIGLRLPDFIGVELPILVAMCGMVLVHISGRMTTGLLSDDAQHLAVLTITLVLLAGMGLMGRNDLGLRIPSALEAVLGLLVIDRVVCVLLGGEVPLPFAADPFASSMTEWTLPLFGVEVVLLGAVLMYDWVEGERLRRKLEDHRGAFGRSTWVVGAAVLSLGPASAMAVLFALRRCLAWQQPAVAMTTMLLAPFVVQSWVVWLLSPLSSLLTPANVAAAFGFVALAWTVALVARRNGLWLSSALWSTHGLLIPAAVLNQSLVALSLATTIVSATAWISGILAQRKSWRIVGAADLAVAWMVAAVALVAGVGASYVLLLLVASAALLFAVTTLTQANERALMDV